MYELVLLCLVAFAAGFIDAIVGGGGLLQTPRHFAYSTPLSGSHTIGHH